MRAVDETSFLVSSILMYCSAEISVYSDLVTDALLSIKDSVNMLRLSLKNDISVVEEYKIGHGLVVSVGKEQLHQVIVNLLTNAAYAMRGREGMVRIVVDSGECIRAKGQCLIIKVIDQGEGIDYNYLDKIFDPFFTTKPTGEGTGLGLSVVEGIVQNAGGTIDVDSVLHQGTEITVYLPIIDKTMAMKKIMDKDIMIRKKMANILVIDDEIEIVGMLQNALERYGHSVKTAYCSREALEKISTNNLDLLVTDYKMPGMNGMDLVKKAREIKKDMPAIVITGNRGSVKELLDFTIVIDKPFELKELIAKINIILA